MIVNNKYITAFLVLFFSASSFLFTQNIEFKNSNFKNSKDKLKLAKENIKMGDDYREKGLLSMLALKDANDDYSAAFFYYKKAYDFNPNNAELNYKIGSSLLFTNNKEKAFDFLESSRILSEELPEDFRFYYAMSLQLQNEFLKAIEQFKEFKNTAKKKYVQQYEILTNKYIQECEEAIGLMKQEYRLWIDNLSINTEYDEWSPCLSTDGDLLIFSSNRPNQNSSNQIGVYDYDIYYSKRLKRKFRDVSSLVELNTSFNDIVGGISYDGQRLLIFKEEDGDTDVYESKLSGLNWTPAIRKMGVKLRGGNTEYNESFASYDPPDVKVYYITEGGYSKNKDIYFSGVINKENRIWGNGQSAGNKINTRFEENSVYIHPDARTMYFSSKGHNTLGGYDIFVSYVDELGHWGEPINLGYPINTVYDDIFYSPNASGRLAYIASNRPGGKGGLDIYKITYWGEDKPMTIDFEDQLFAYYTNPVSDDFIAEPISVEEKSLTVFKGVVKDAINQDPIFSNIVISNNSTGEKYTQCQSNSETGKFLLSLPAGKNYGISVSAEGYLFHSENFNIINEDRFNVVEKNILLKKISVGSNITLRNVFFNTGKFDIQVESHVELDRLVAILEDIPSLKIEISGHTDNIGEESYNLLLSQRRADAVVRYLVDAGISSERLSAKGYGESKPVDSNNSLEGRANNRRTEFEILDN